MVPSLVLKQVKACGIVCFDTIIYQVSNSSIGTIGKYILIQECIPVGYVPPATVAVGGRGLPQCMLGYTPGCGPGDPPGCWPGDTPQVWAWRPPRSNPSTSPLGVGLEPPPPARPSTSPLGVGLETCKAWWDTTPPKETCCKACWDTTCNACWDTTTLPP